MDKLTTVELINVRDNLLLRHQQIGKAIEGLNTMIEMYSADENSILAKPLTHLAFPVRAYAVFHEAKITTIGELVEFHNPNELMRYRNFGRSSFYKVKETLEEAGLRFKNL